MVDGAGEGLGIGVWCYETVKSRPSSCLIILGEV